MLENLTDTGMLVGRKSVEKLFVGGLALPPSTSREVTVLP
jgi:hypothetical protein